MTKRLAIKAARTIAEKYRLRQVIVIAWDGKQTHVATFGTTPADADSAALGGDKIKAELGWPVSLRGEVPTRVARLLQRLDRLEQIVEPFCEYERPTGDDVNPLLALRVAAADHLRSNARAARHCARALRENTLSRNAVREHFGRAEKASRLLIAQVRALDRVIAGAQLTAVPSPPSAIQEIEQLARKLVEPCSLRDLMRRIENLRVLFAKQAEVKPS